MKKVVMFLVLFSIFLVHVFSYTITVTVTTTSTSANPSESDTPGEWNTEEGESVKIDGPPDQQSSYPEGSTMPTTETQSSHEVTVDIPGNVPYYSEEFVDAVQDAIDESNREMAATAATAGNTLANTTSVQNEISQITMEAGMVTITLDANKVSVNPTLLGDPVRATTGQFILDETDLIVRGGELVFPITRHYISDAGLWDSLASQWYSSLDTRIIRGYRPDTYRKESELYAEMESIRANLVTAQELVVTIDADYSQGITRATTVLQTLSTQLEDLRTCGYASYAPVISRIEETEAATASVTAMRLAFLANRGPNLAAANATVAEITADLRDISALHRQALNERDHFDQNQLLNSSVLGRQGFVDSIYCGNEKLIIYDERGTVHLFEILTAPVYGNGWNHYPSGSLTQNLVPGDKTSLVLLSNGRLRWTRDDGYIWEYSRQGQLERIENRNGDALVVEYTSNQPARITYHGRTLATIGWSPQGYLSTLTDSTGRVVSYNYTGGRLSSVTDIDNDTVRFEYENERLVRIIKPDEVVPGDSYIELHYGLETSDGKSLVTSTVHEEGSTERFDYNVEANHTRHTDYSGVITDIYYDDSHRTIREVRNDGTVKQFIYNPVTGFLDSESVNGNVTNYLYDARGNRLRATYVPDASFERWEWNAFDQMTLSVDRDGVQTVWTYDEFGNCLFIHRSNSSGSFDQLFSATYDSRGRILTSQNGTQAPQSFTYDPLTGFLASATRIIDEDEIVEEWTTDSTGRVLSYTDALNRSTTYRYEGRNVVETSPSRLERTYVYNNRKDLVSVVERDLVTGETRTTTIEYDKRHLPLVMTDGAGNETRYTYRADGKLESAQYGQWHKAYAYNAGGQLTGVTTTMTRDDGTTETTSETYGYEINAQGERRTVTRSGPEMHTVSTTYQFDPWNRVVELINPLGEASIREVSPAGRLQREQTASGGFIAYEYDESGQLVNVGKEGQPTVAVTYNSDGTVHTRTDRNNVVTTYAYDGRGLLLRESTTAGYKAYVYDPAGRVIRSETVTANPVTPGEGQYVSEWQYNDIERSVTLIEGGVYRTTMALNAWNEVTAKTDGEGNIFRQFYDGAGRLIRSLDAYNRETRYTWNALGKLSAIQYPDNTTETYTYNVHGQVSTITDSIGIRWSGTYDSLGRLLSETGRPGIDKSYTYDDLNRITAVYSGGELIESYAYSERGRTVTMRDGNGGTYQYQKDAFAVLQNEQNRLGDTRTFAYDAEGRSTDLTQFSGKHVQTQYNDATGTTTTLYQDGSQTTHVRDYSGRLTRVTGSTGTITYHYDSGGRLTRQSDDKAGEESFYEYNAAGRRTRLSSGNRDIRYAYGSNGELLGVSDLAQRLAVSYTYDVMGRETTRRYGNGIVQETSYDSAGRVTLIREIAPSRELLRAEGYLYDALGRRNYSVDERGNVTIYVYDAQSRLASVLYPYSEEKAEADRAEAEEARLHFTPDSGSPERYMLEAAVIEPLRSLLDRMAPSRGNILAVANMQWRESFTYDHNGNRATKTTTWGTLVYRYDAENRLASVGETTYSYDRDGNLLSVISLRKTAQYEYTDTNRMKASVVTDHVARTRDTSRYGYDALGRRTLVADVGGRTMRTLYDGQSFDAVREGVSFADGSFTTNFTEGASSQTGSQGRYRWLGEESAPDADADGYTPGTARYTGLQTTLYAGGRAVAMNRSGGESYTRSTAYFGTDLLGSVRSATGEYGELEDRYEYDAFGKPYLGDLASGQSFGYTGKPYDTVTGMYNYGYRDYTPEVARFSTVDPIRDGNNWFAYVNNDPVNYLDPWGLSASDQRTGIDFVIIRDPRSYDTVNNQNSELRGKDVLIFTNYDTQESLTIPITSVPTMKGTVLGDAVAPGNVELMLGPEHGSKYSPNVLTITGGTLMSGDTLRSDGTTENNSVPWRGHDTNFYGSEGCLVGKTGNTSGSMVNVVETLQSWGVEYGDKISGTLISGPRGH